MSETDYKRLYQRAKRPEDLPWHREEPPEWLAAAVAEKGKPGRFLDLGCGAGVFSVQLAQKGYDVTAVDFTPEALEMARAKAAGVKIRFFRADVLAWDCPETFDLVLDSGCLHSLAPRDRPRYKPRLLRWLAPGADYVLVHFGRRHFLDWRPMGPRRRKRKEILGELTPDLTERRYKDYVRDAELPIGPTIQLCEYWFQKKS